MTAICGACSFGAPLSLADDCKEMMRAQAEYGPDNHALAWIPGLALGRSLFRLLPEDRFDRQPIEGAGGRLLLVADIRIDNRTDIISTLGLERSVGACLSDSALLMAGLERWGAAVVDRISGDYAFAWWDHEQRSLNLARDPFGQRPLFYRADNRLFAFASMPAGLHGLGIRPVADLERIAEFLADVVLPTSRTCHQGISQLETGHILTVSAQGLRTRRFWNPQPTTLRLPALNDYADAYREQVDQAVASRLRGAQDGVATHLSSGLDSSVVTATSARQAASRQLPVFSYTAAPRAGLDLAPARGRIDDESGYAALTAGLYPNVRHEVIRPASPDPFALLKEGLRFSQQPLGHVCNNVWWAAIDQAAQDRGLRVLLTGQRGNYTISAGGLFQLADMVRTGDLATWIRESRAVIREEGVRWRGVLANSFGPWMPRPAWLAISHLFMNTSLKLGQPFLLTQAWAAEMESKARKSTREIRPPKNSFDQRVAMLRFHDDGNSRKHALARYSLDERDPTADRRLVEFCLSLPHDMLLKNGRRRPLAKMAMSDRLPTAILDLKVRGAQAADWFEFITPQATKNSFDEVRHSSDVRNLLDMRKIDQMIARWPTSGWEQAAIISEYRVDLMHALSAAHFIVACENWAPPKTVLKRRSHSDGVQADGVSREELEFA
jgi:asparagine synthase (glutamine-hydrolysing)